MDTFSGQGGFGEKQAGSGQVGAVLRAARERLGEPLGVAAETLRIRQAYLEAIEEGRYGDLPGVAYAIGFVRAYADHLGLHAEEVVRRFKDESHSQTVSNTLEFPAAANEGGVPAGTMIAFAVLLAVCAYGAWYWISTSEKPVAELIPDIPERMASLIGGDRREETAPAPVDQETQVAQRPEATPDTAETEAGGTAVETVETNTPESSEGEPGIEATGASDAAAGIGTTMEGEPAPSEGLAASSVPTAAPEGDTTADRSEVVVGGADAAHGETGMPRPPMKPEAKEADVTAQADTEPEAAVAAKPAPTPAVEPEPAPEETSSPEPDANSAPPSEPVAITEKAVEEAATVVETPPKPEAEVSAVPVPDAEPVPAPEPTPDAGAAPPPPPAAEVEETPRVAAFVGQAAPADVVSRGQGARIVLRATSDTWIQLRQGSDFVVRRLLRAGDVYGVPSTAGLNLNVTNAGALEVYVDGKRGPALGPAGAVRNNIPLSPNRLKSGR